MKQTKQKTKSDSPNHTSPKEANDDVEKNRVRPLESIGPRDLADGSASEAGQRAFNSDARHPEVRSAAERVAKTEGELSSLGSELRGGDPDVVLEDAALVGDEVPGGSNPTPDQGVVDDIGRAYGLQYADDEPIAPTGKIAKRDDHRWELNPASSEDFADRTNDLTNPQAHVKKKAEKPAER